jgi:hypothetical protein
MSTRHHLLSDFDPAELEECAYASGILRTFAGQARMKDSNDRASWRLARRRAA